MRVYFDYNATTPLAPEVTDAVLRAMRDVFGVHTPDSQLTGV